MARWGICSVHRIGTAGDPYLDRYRLLQTPWFGIYLHRIHRPDLEPDGHDHPWWFWRLVLWGAYTERFWPNKDNPGWYCTWHLRWLSMGTFRRDAAHRITWASQPVWTLVVVGRDHDEWGFWPGGQYVRWQDYFAPAAGERRSHKQPWDTSSIPVVWD